MARYYFDLRDVEDFVLDEHGTELRDLSAVRNEAARTLSGLAWDAMRKDTQVQQMSIEVRDCVGPVLEVKLAFVISCKL